MIDELEALLMRLAATLQARGATLATAESCTGGLIAAACTSLAGASDWFERGFVCYSNAAKTEMLGVPIALIAAQGAVSDAVARAMAEGALAHSSARFAVSVTGIAGPGGGTPDKPVGTVWLALAEAGRPTRSQLLQLTGDRESVRRHTVAQALKVLCAHLDAGPEPLT